MSKIKLWRRVLARLLGVKPAEAAVRVDITCPHGAFFPANYRLDRPGVEAGRLSCDHCEMRVTLSWGDRAAMLNRRDQVLNDHPGIETAEQIAPLMGDLEQAYWDWTLSRFHAGERPVSRDEAAK